MTDTRDWIDLLERREREAEAQEALAAARPEPGSAAPAPAQALAGARRAAGLSAADVAARSGVSAEAVERLEGPEHDQHSLATLRRVAESLGLELRIDVVPRR